MQQPELSNSEAQRGDNIAALLHHLGTLQPGETRRLITQLGPGAELSSRRCPGIQTLLGRSSGRCRRLRELRRFWDDYLAALQVETPDASMNSMLNIHNPHQCHTTKNWSRYLSLYQLGMGSRGIGFRDSSQDVMGVVGHIPDESRALIAMLLSVQKRDGSAMHQFNPLTMEAIDGRCQRDAKIARTITATITCGSILAVCAYLKETGDLGVSG